jgi:manganese/iron transport system ATP-binding protein
MYPHITHDSNQPILQVNALTVKYQDQEALKELTFHLHPGERVAVVGPNGAGKSTLFKVVAGVLMPTSGDVQVYGNNPGKHVCIAYIPQRTQVDWHFPVNVSDVVMMGRAAKMKPFGWPSRADHQAVNHALATVDLKNLAERQISELSGGQQQRMFIARALAQEAELIMMDEPLSGLDTPSQEGVLALLETLHQKNVTVMVATHDLDQASTYFDRILLLNHRIIGFGSPKEVMTTERLLKAFGGRLKIVDANGDTVLMDDNCCHGGDD